jgi:hypothetical protein
MATENRLEEAFSPENVQATIKKIQRRIWEEDAGKATERIREQISDRFCKSITGEDDPAEENFPYNSLEPRAQEQIGYIEGIDSEEELPWWLEQFEWKFDATGGGQITVPADDLDQLASFDPEKTRVEKPQFDGGSGRHDLSALIKGLVRVRDELVEHVEIDDPNELITGDDKIDVPEQIFGDLQSEEDRIETTDEFKNWLGGLVSLCPTFEETTTALLWYNVGLPTHAVEDLGIDTEILDSVGLVNGDHVYSEAYRDALTDIMRFQGIFDWEVNTEPKMPDSRMGSGLEAAYIHVWAQGIDRLNDDEQETIRRCSENWGNPVKEDERNKRAAHCLELPVWYESPGDYYPTFDTQGRRNYNSRLNKYNESQPDRAEAIVTALESDYGLLDPENNES